MKAEKSLHISDHVPRHMNHVTGKNRDWLSLSKLFLSLLRSSLSVAPATFPGPCFPPSFLTAEKQEGVFINNTDWGHTQGNIRSLPLLGWKEIQGSRTSTHLEWEARPDLRKINSQPAFGPRVTELVSVCVGPHQLLWAFWWGFVPCTVRQLESPWEKELAQDYSLNSTWSHTFRPPGLRHLPFIMPAWQASLTQGCFAWGGGVS